MIGLALAMATTILIVAILAIWKMASIIGIPATLFCVAGATAMMIFDHIRDSK